MKLSLLISYFCPLIENMAVAMSRLQVWMEKLILRSAFILLKWINFLFFEIVARVFYYVHVEKGVKFLSNCVGFISKL